MLDANIVRENQVTATGETPVTPPVETSQPNATQNRDVSATIFDIGEMLARVRADTELCALLATYGMDAAALTEGETLQKAAQDAYVARMQALGAALHATEAIAALLPQVKQTYYDFRIVVRSVLPSRADRVALATSGEIPHNQQLLLQQIRTSYETARVTPAYLDALIVYGYGLAKLTANLSDLSALEKAKQAQSNAQVDAVAATRARDEAIAALNKWNIRFNGIARVATRNRLDFAMKMKLN